MMFKSFKLAAMIGALALATPSAVQSTDVFSCGALPKADGEPCDDLTFDLLETKNGIEYATLEENLGNELGLGGTPGTVDLTFKFIRDTGDFQFCFGFCRASTLSQSLLDSIRAGGADHNARKAFAVDCIVNNGIPVFDDVSLPAIGDGTMTAVIEDVPVPEEVIFFLIPNNKGADFAANPDLFFAPEGTTTSRASPLFSLSEANPGERDQLVLYQNGVDTVFTWEDKQRVPGSPFGASDEDFSDLVFTVDYVLMPDVPGGPCDGCDLTQASYSRGTNTAASAASTSGNTCASLEFNYE